MHVRVGKAGQHGLTLQIDHLRLRAALAPEDIGRASHGDDAAILHGHGFGN